MQTLDGPFGPARLSEQLPAAVVEAMYRRKCDAAVDFAALGVDMLELYECERTGLRFWRPERLTGDEAFYQQLSRKWPHYYHSWRWQRASRRGSMRSAAFRCWNTSSILRGFCVIAWHVCVPAAG